MNITLNHNITTDIKIEGGYFTNNTTVNIPGITVNGISEIDDDYIICSITTGNVDATHDIEVTNESGTTVFVGGIIVELSVWDDLRHGGTSYNIGTDIRVRAGMTVNRDSNGMYFTGSNPWSSWVKFEKFLSQRSDNKTFQFIFTAPTSFMMIGIGSNATDENSTAQYAQAENQAYFNSDTNFWGLYGNNGNVGIAGNQNFNTAISNTGVYKVKFEDSGSQGGLFTLYQIPSSNQSDWDDESNILASFNVGGTLNPDETDIMPFIIPRTDTQRFIALKVE